MASNSSVDDAIQINIELEDLRELARINPLAWEQLLHIGDNRRNAERIAELEKHLAHAVKWQGENGVKAAVL